jgi:hypothetical protein
MRDSDPVVADFDRETRARERTIVGDQAGHAQKFENAWAEERLKQHQKSSEKVVELRNQLRELVTAGDDDAARELQEEIAATEAEEREVQEQQYWADYQAAKLKFNDRLQNQLNEFRAFREKLRAKLVNRAKGIYTGPFDVPPAPRSITVVRPHPYANVLSKPRPKIMAPLCNTRTSPQLRRKTATIGALTQVQPENIRFGDEEEDGDEQAQGERQLNELGQEADEVESETGDEEKQDQNEGEEETSESGDQAEANEAGDEPSNEEEEEINDGAKAAENERNEGDDETGQEVAGEPSGEIVELGNEPGVDVERTGDERDGDEVADEPKETGDEVADDPNEAGDDVESG